MLDNDVVGTIEADAKVLLTEINLVYKYFDDQNSFLNGIHWMS